MTLNVLSDSTAAEPGLPAPDQEQAEAGRQEPRQLDNIARILNHMQGVETEHTLRTAHDSDLRTGVTRITTLTADLKPFSFWGEALLSGFLAVLWISGLAKLVPEAFGESVRAWLIGLGAWETVTIQEGRDFGAALLGVGLLGLEAGWRWLRHKGQVRVRRQVIQALHRVSELYIAHSAMNERLQRAGHQRVQVEAKIHPFAEMTWRQIETRGATTLMRGYLQVLADIDGRRLLEEARFERAGGEYWLELLRAGLRGELPLVVCLYAACVLDDWAPGDRDRLARKWRGRTVRLCRAERKIFGEMSEEKARAYRALEARLRNTRGFSLSQLDALLIVWGQHHPGQFRPEAAHRDRFGKACVGCA